MEPRDDEELCVSDQQTPVDTVDETVKSNLEYVGSMSQRQSGVTRETLMDNTIV